MLLEMGREPTPEELGERGNARRQGTEGAEDRQRAIDGDTRGDDEDSSLGDFIEDITTTVCPLILRC